MFIKSLCRSGITIERISREEPSQGWVVVPGSEVDQPGLRVVLLPREPEAARLCRGVSRGGEDVVAPRARDAAIGVRQGDGGAEVVLVVVVLQAVRGAGPQHLPIEAVELSSLAVGFFDDPRQVGVLVVDVLVELPT